MRIYTKLVYDITETGLELRESEWYEYDGPIAECKKGDKEKAVGKQQQDYANKEQGIQDSYRATADPFEKSLISTQPGQMDPYSAAQYGSELDNISSTYNNLRQAGFKALGARGFGNAPSGMTSSMVNSINNSEGNAQTGAYRTGLENTLNHGLEAGNYFQKGQQIYNPDQAYSGATNSYVAGDNQVAQSWKTGIGAATGIASMFIPGGGFAQLGSKLGSGLKTYGMSNPGDSPVAPV